VTALCVTNRAVPWQASFQTLGLSMHAGCIFGCRCKLVKTLVVQVGGEMETPEDLS
jgi:hypothetical protein